MTTSERQIQQEKLWSAIRPLQYRLERRLDKTLLVNVDALITEIAQACDGPCSFKAQITTAKLLLSLGHVGAALDKARTILIEAHD